MRTVAAASSRSAGWQSSRISEPTCASDGNTRRRADRNLSNPHSGRNGRDSTSPAVHAPSVHGKQSSAATGNTASRRVDNSPLWTEAEAVEATCPKCRSRVVWSSPAPPLQCPSCGAALGLGDASGAPTIGPGSTGDDYVPFSGTEIGTAKTILSDTAAPGMTAPTGILYAGEGDPTMPATPAGTPAPPSRPSGIRRVSAPATPAPAATEVHDPSSLRTVTLQRPGQPDIRASQDPTAAVGTPPPARPAGQGSGFTNSRPENVDLVGRMLDGYYVKKKLGAGGMGAVLLATQKSLDRDVALKVLPGQFASNPDFLARFTREALSAGQLNHHNIIQVYDVGVADGIHYIAMEFVRGKSLGDVTRTEGKLSIEDAASYVLQTARGLQYAHDRGIIHRDIKPDNIMINEHGIVKIADMGLAKMHGYGESGVGLDYGGEDALKSQAYGELTNANVAMGTPAYMAPEQGRDASKVDHRADQYSLGCTLYYLVAGKTPFTGKTTFEIISKHATEPLIPIETIVKNVPKELSYIIEKMLAKNPADRYNSLKEVIAALEAYLGVESNKGPYTPREHHVDVLEKNLAAFYGAPLLKMRWIVKLAFFAVCLVAFLALAVMQQPFAAGAMLGMMVLTPLFHFVLNGIMTKSFLFRRVRSVFFGMNLKSWAILVLGSAAVLITLYFFSLLLPWAVVSVVALAAAFGWEFGVLRRLRQSRQPSLDATNEMLKQLRIRGVSEDQLHDFVYRFSGVHWEEFFEELFGYEDMMVARGRFAKQDKVKPRKKFATWRDPIFRWLDEIEEGRRKLREKKQLARAEKERLKAGGMTEAAAEAEADRLAKTAIEVGLLKTAILPAGPSRADIERIDRELHQSSKKSRSRGKIGWAYFALRLLVGGLAFTTAALPYAASAGVSAPPFLTNLLNSWYVPLGYGNYWATGVGGLFMLLTLFSRRFLAPFLIFLGTIFMACAVVLSRIAGNPAFTPQVSLLCGMALALVGFAAFCWGVFRGKK
ncbi:protein kinase [bacterium]|nr:protein kinase [bacterium]